MSLIHGKNNVKKIVKLEKKDIRKHILLSSVDDTVKIFAPGNISVKSKPYSKILYQMNKESRFN